MVEKFYMKSAEKINMLDYFLQKEAHSSSRPAADMEAIKTRFNSVPEQI